MQVSALFKFSRRINDVVTSYHFEVPGGSTESTTELATTTERDNWREDGVITPGSKLRVLYADEWGSMLNESDEKVLDLPMKRIAIAHTNTKSCHDQVKI